MRDTMLTSCIVLPDGAAAKARRQFGLGPDAPLRIAYIPGAGDVVGTYRHWLEGAFDPRVPVIAYSTMFYELVRQLGAEALIATPFDVTENPKPPFSFAQVGRPDWSGRIGYWRSQRTYAAEVSVAVDRFAPHVVVVSSDFPPSGWQRLGRGRRLILSAHNTFWPMGHPSGALLARLRRSLLGMQIGALKGAVCTSHECMRQIRSLTKGRLESSVECPQIVAQYETAPKLRARRLLYLGRIEENKGVFLLLQAFAALRGRHNELSLDFAGAGSAEADLKARIAALGDDRVRYVGSLTSEGVHNALANADLLVCPTLTTFNEGLALVGFEAAAHGVPSVLSSIVPARELLGDGCAVFKADSLEELVDILAGLVGDDNAYARLCAGLKSVTDRIYDRSASWGSQLCRTILQGDAN